MRPLRLLLATTLLTSLAAASPSSAAPPDPVRSYFYVPAPDGTPLRACAIAGPGALSSSKRDHAVVVEWTSYAIDADFGGGFPAGCPPQFARLADAAARKGYVYVAVNTRGTGASGGDHQDVWSRSDARDGAAVVAWLAKQPWSTGRVGLVGCSNSGALANGVAALHPPALKAVVTACAPLDPYRDAFYPGGLASYALLFTSSRPVASQVTPGGAQEALSRGDTSVLTRAAVSSRTQAELATTRTDDAVWRDRDLTGSVPFRVPTFYFGSWADYMLRGTTEYARVLGPQDRVLITPGPHASVYSQVNGRYGLIERSLAWFDHHLARRGPAPYAAEPQVQWWELDGGRSPLPMLSSPAVTLAGRFRGDRQWPPADVTYRQWWLDGGTSGTSRSVNDRVLATAKPRSEGSASYAYPGASGATFADSRQPGGDSAPPTLTDSGDVATWTSAPLTKPLHLAGPVSATVWASTTSTEADWVVRLIVVAADGTPTELTTGWLTSAFRALDNKRSLVDRRTGEITRPFHDQRTAVPVTPGAALEHVVELLPTATVIPAGARIRVVVQSTATPWFVQRTAPAAQTVLFGPAHPSRLVLPVVPPAALR